MNRSLCRRGIEYYIQLDSKGLFTFYMIWKALFSNQAGFEILVFLFAKSFFNRTFVPRFLSYKEKN